MQNNKKEEFDVQKAYGTQATLSIEEFKEKYHINEDGLTSSQVERKLENSEGAPRLPVQDERIPSTAQPQPMPQLEPYTPSPDAGASEIAMLMRPILMESGAFCAMIEAMDVPAL